MNLSTSFKVAKIQNFALVLNHLVAKNPKKFLSILNTLFKVLPALKNLEVVVGYNWHNPYYQNEIKLIEIDENFTTWVKDEHAWDQYGGLQELTHITEILDLNERVKKVWKRCVD